MLVGGVGAPDEGFLARHQLEVDGARATIAGNLLKGDRVPLRGQKGTLEGDVVHGVRLVSVQDAEGACGHVAVHADDPAEEVVFLTEVVIHGLRVDLGVFLAPLGQSDDR